VSFDRVAILIGRLLDPPAIILCPRSSCRRSENIGEQVENPANQKYSRCARLALLTPQAKFFLRRAIRKAEEYSLAVRAMLL
jgi:hypothetical protein